MTYTEKGDSTANETATTAVQQQLHGTTRVSLEGSGDPEQTKDLTDALRNNGIAVADGAPVAIHFNGRIAHRGMGRKRRSAEATITKSGRVLLHYIMPPEDYRVGDTPAEAFERVLSELLK